MFWRKKSNTAPGPTDAPENVVKLDVGLSHDLYLEYHADNDIVSELVKRNWFEMVETKYIIENVKQGNVVLDIGANIGYYTLVIGSLVGSEGNVYAFEPDDLNFSLLQKNIYRNNLRWVQPFKVAVSNESGIVHLNQSTPDNRGNHTILKMNNKSIWPSSSIQPSITLDALMNAGIEHVDFIKMDTQGAEPLIFDGGHNLIERNAKHLKMVVEFTPSWIAAASGRDCREFYHKIIDYGFKGLFFDERTKEVNPIDDLDELLRIVNLADGVVWPKNLTFVDMVFVPRD